MNETVKLTQQKNNIALVTMEDKEYKNTFSKQLIEGLVDVFEAIRNDIGVKAVVIHGYDNYFCCGGTKEELISIFEGKARFTDLNFYDLLLRCEVPVIAAMQGHALGGGLAFGCYADLIVMAEECLYSTNFMKYGFTPGMGATYIVPRKFGHVLGTEMLFSARNYYGGELRDRGASAKVVKKENVIKTALHLADELADIPVLPLKELKRRLAGPIRKALPGVIHEELIMHNACFSQPEVRDRIESYFGN